MEDRTGLQLGNRDTAANMDVDPQRLAAHVARIAASPRPGESEELRRCRAYVTECLEACGWIVTRHPFDATTAEGASLEGINLVARHTEHPQAAGPQFCVGAHLDSTPNSPGADDNASAVAGMLEIARLLPQRWPFEAELGLELVAFDLEENMMLGGAEHVRRTADAGIDLRGMISLEMIGYCDASAGSQNLPRQLVGKYPDTGDFIAVIGNQNSGALIDRFASGMKRVRGLPVETLQVPSNGDYLQATRLSDHSPFWDAGYPALMITDTSFLRNPNYHMPSDTPETLDIDFVTLVTQGCLLTLQSILAEGL